MTPQMDEADSEEDEANPYQSAAEAKARVIQLRDKALGFWHNDEWESIMNMYTNEGFFDTLLCWIRPTRDFLSFLHAELRRLHVTKIVSVGCGCGFLEWLIKRACSGIEVIGYEVDRAWWQGRYGVKPFIEHIYIDEVKTRHVPEGSVLMTCYFHSWECWEQYLAEFRGDLVIVIGPHSNDHLAFPEPRHLLTDRRFLLESQRPIDGGDMVVVLRRNEQVWPRPPPPPEPADAPPLPSVKPPEDRTEQAKRFNEMRRSLVMDRICSAKRNPPPPPPDPKVRQGPALQSTYKTRKPSLAFSLGTTSVASRLKALGGADSPGGMKRSVSASARLETVGLSRDARPRGSRASAEPESPGGRTPGRRRKRSSGDSGNHLAVDGAFAGRPLRESRSVPSLAPLRERAELDAELRSGAHGAGRRESRHELDRRDSGHGTDGWHGGLQPGRRNSGLGASRRNSGHGTDRGSSGNDSDRRGSGTDSDRRNSGHERDADKTRRKPTRRRFERPSADSETGPKEVEQKPLRRRAAAGQPPPPPLVTVTDLGDARRRRSNGSRWPDNSPSR